MIVGLEWECVFDGVVGWELYSPCPMYPVQYVAQSLHLHHRMHVTVWVYGHYVLISGGVALCLGVVMFQVYSRYPGADELHRVVLQRMDEERKERKEHDERSAKNLKLQKDLANAKALHTQAKTSSPIPNSVTILDQDDLPVNDDENTLAR